MSKYPFGEYVSDYMETMRGVYAEETWNARMRRYKRMERKIIDLKKEGRISTMSPKSMTSDDIRTYILYCKELVSTADLVHEVNALHKILLYANNNAMDICFNHNPGLKPFLRGNRRKKAMEPEVYDTILQRSKEIDPMDFKLVRAYTLVLLCLNTGTRNKEIRFASVNDLDTDRWMLDIIHVKGEATYGQQRQVPIPPEIRPLVLNYLLFRKKWVVDNNADSQALFPSKYSDDGFLSSNSIRNIKVIVEKDAKVKFDLRMCRRTFGQRYLDRDLDIESVSVLMGHSSTKTTEGFYSRKKLDHAIQNAIGTWEDQGRE